MVEAEKSRSITISVPRPLLRELYQITGERMRTTGRGSVSQVLRELVEVGLAQRKLKGPRPERG